MKQLATPAVWLLLTFLVSPMRGLPSSVTKQLNHLVKEDIKTLERHYSNNRLKRSIAQEDIKCDQRSLMAILENCKNAARESVGSTTSNKRRRRSSSDTQSFCGSSCSHLVFEYTNVCNLQEFVVNVSGACKLRGSDFKVNCIHAAVVVKPGILSCMNTHQESVSHDVSPLVDSSRTYRQSKCCSLQTSYNSSLPGHRIIFDHQHGDFRVDPPLIPPWKDINVSEYPPILDLTSTSLCEEKVMNNNKTETPDTKHVDTNGKSLNSSSKQNNACTSSTALFSSVMLFSWCVYLLLPFRL